MSSRKECLVVAGMHRSGTSAVTGVFELLGYSPGNDLMAATEFNARGHFESMRINDLNNRLLSHHRMSWKSPILPGENWAVHDDLDPFRTEARDVLRDEFASADKVVVKDPRLCILLPFWKGVLADLTWDVKYLIMVRHPGAVARSLSRRDGMDTHRAFILWINYLLSIEQYTRDETRCFVRYEDLLRSPHDLIPEVGAALGLGVSEVEPEKAAEIDEFLDSGLQRFREEELSGSTLPMQILGDLSALFVQLTRDPRDETVMSQIDRLKTDFMDLVEFFYNEDVREELLTSHARIELAWKRQRTIESKQREIDQLREDLESGPHQGC